MRVAGPQGRGALRCSVRGHMRMCGESAARASRVPSPVQACTGRHVAVVGACRGVAPFEFRVYTLVAFYSCFNAHRDLLRQRRRGKLQLLSHAFASEHAPGSSHAVETATAWRFVLDHRPVVPWRVLFAAPLCARLCAVRCGSRSGAKCYRCVPAERSSHSLAR